MSLPKLTADRLLLFLMDVVESDEHPSINDGSQLFLAAETAGIGRPQSQDFAIIMNRLRYDGFADWEQPPVGEYAEWDPNGILNSRNFVVTGAGRSHALQLRKLAIPQAQEPSMPTLDAVKCLQATLLELRDHLDDVAPLEGARLRSIQDSLGQQVGGLRGLLTRHAGGKLHVRAESDSTGYYTWDAWNDIADSREDLPDIRSIRRAISSLDTLIGKLAANEPEPTIGSLHARVEAKALELYRSSHFMEAGEASVRAVRELIRERAGLTLDGEDLVTQAFSVDKPRLRFSDLSTKTQSNEQVGFMTMLQGYWKHVRHVLAHSDDASHLDEQSTWDLLMMASWICRSVDRCETVSSQGAAHQ